VHSHHATKNTECMNLLIFFYILYFVCALLKFTVNFAPLLYVVFIDFLKLYCKMEANAA